MSRIIQYGIHFNEMAKKHGYLTGALFISAILGNLIDAGIGYSIIIAVAGTVWLFAIWRK